MNAKQHRHLSVTEGIGIFLFTCLWLTIILV